MPLGFIKNWDSKYQRQQHLTMTWFSAGRRGRRPLHYVSFVGRDILDAPHTAPHCRGRVSRPAYTKFKEFRVIARSNATWQSPGRMLVFASVVDRLYQEIATGINALAMTAVVGGALRGRSRAVSLGCGPSGGPVPTTHRSVAVRDCSSARNVNIHPSFI